jgi:dTDP-4-dehydrorhamnose reductase
VLSNAKLKSTFGLQLLPWQSALDEMLATIEAQPRA